MRTRFLFAAGGLILALTSPALAAPTAGAAGTGGAVGRGGGAAAPAVPCQSNLNPALDTGMGVNAQKRAPSSLSTIGASNFLVPAGGSCTVNYVIVVGKFYGSGSVSRVNIGIKADGVTAGLHHPAGPNLAPGNTGLVPSSVVTTPPPYYNMTTNLAVPVTLTAPPSSSVRYWLVFQAKVKSKKSIWNWEVTVPDPAGEGDDWRNPGGAAGCGSAWLTVTAPCLGSIQGKGLMMEIGT